jgi:hypothetical protein
VTRSRKSRLLSSSLSKISGNASSGDAQIHKSRLPPSSSETSGDDTSSGGTRSHDPQRLPPSMTFSKMTTFSGDSHNIACEPCQLLPSAWSAKVNCQEPTVMQIFDLTPSFCRGTTSAMTDDGHRPKSLRVFDLASLNLWNLLPSMTNQVFLVLYNPRVGKGILWDTAVGTYWSPPLPRKMMAINHRQSPATSAGMKILEVLAQRNTYWTYLYSHDCILFDMLFDSIVCFIQVFYLRISIPI